MIRSGVAIAQERYQGVVGQFIVRFRLVQRLRVAAFSKDLILVLELLCYQDYFRFSGEKSLDYLGVKLCTAKGGYF